jgi:hypothetical protein
MACFPVKNLTRVNFLFFNTLTVQRQIVLIKMPWIPGAPFRAGGLRKELNPLHLFNNPSTIFSGNPPTLMEFARLALKLLKIS